MSFFYVASAALASFVGLSWISSSSSKLIYHPHRDYLPVDIEYEKHVVTTADEQTLECWYVGGPAASSGAKSDDIATDSCANAPVEGCVVGGAEGGDGDVGPRDYTIIVYFHGNAGNNSHFVDNAAALCRGCPNTSVFMVEYRGFGNSTGRPSQSGLMKDADAAIAYVNTVIVPRFMTKDTPIRRRPCIVLYGLSLGGAVAIAAADRGFGYTYNVFTGKCSPDERYHGASHNNIHFDGVIVENTFTCISDMTDVITRKILGDSLTASVVSASAGSIIGRQWNSYLSLASVNCPVLFVSGDADELIPPTHMHTLRGFSGHPKSALVNIPGGGHCNTWAVGGNTYITAINKFINSL